MKQLVSFLLIATLFLRAAPGVSAKLLINEFSSGTATDWIEIYNDSDSDIPLSLYSFRDSSSSNKLELNGILSAKGFTVFEWNDRLNNTGDTIKIVKTDQENEVEDQVSYGTVDGKMVDAPSPSQFAARSTDGTGAFALYTSSTKGYTNANATPAPTTPPTPMDTPKPTPTPTKTPSPTKSVTLYPTQTITTPIVTSPGTVLGSTIWPTPTTDYQVPTAVIGESHEETVSQIPAASTKKLSKVKGIQAVNPAIIMMGVGTLFLLSCLTYGYYLYKRGQLW